MGVLLSKRSSLVKSPSTSLLKRPTSDPTLESDATAALSCFCEDRISNKENSKLCLQAFPVKRGLVVPHFQTSIRMLAISKTTGMENPVPIVPSPDPRKFFALFDEDDVDFEIQIDNLQTPDREVGIRLDIHNRRKKFIVDRASLLNLETVESSGKKFHFLRQSGEEGQIFVGTFAQQNGMSFQEASIIVSQIKINVEYSQPLDPDEEIPSDPIKVQVMQMNGQPLEVTMSKRGSVEELKDRIQKSLGIAKEDQKLIYGGKLLQNERSLEDYRIHECSTVYLVQKVRGGGSSLTPFLKDYVKDFGVNLSKKCSEESENEVGELGAVGFGDKSDQRFCSVNFIADEDITVDDFIIELRMRSRYGFAN